MLANAYGHETGIAEYVIGAILALTREFTRLDRALRQGDSPNQWMLGVAPLAV
jgi:phosphoglycerate dehydrogenase-like enzyme